MIQTKLLLLIIACNLTHTADQAQNSYVARLFAQVTRERCLFTYLNENSKRSLFCVDSLCNVYPKIIREAKNVAFSEEILQQYLTHKEATALMLVSHFHHQQIIKYRKKRIDLHFEETKDGSPALRKIAFNDLGVHPKSVVFDASGNGACGITNDITKIVVFAIYPHYKKISETYIDKSLSREEDSALALASTTQSFILGAMLFNAKKRTYNQYGAIIGTCKQNHVISYLPHGKYKLYTETDPTVGNTLYFGLSDNAAITFGFILQHKQVTTFSELCNNTNDAQKASHYYRSKITTSQSSFDILQKISRNGDIWVPFFTISLPNYKKATAEDEATRALKELHDFSPS